MLEQMAAIGRVEDFFDAIDADDIERATLLMRRAKIDARTIAMVVRKRRTATASTDVDAAALLGLFESHGEQGLAEI